MSYEDCKARVAKMVDSSIGTGEIGRQDGNDDVAYLNGRFIFLQADQCSSPSSGDGKVNIRRML